MSDTLKPKKRQKRKHTTKPHDDAGNAEHVGHRGKFSSQPQESNVFEEGVITKKIRKQCKNSSTNSKQDKLSGKMITETQNNVQQSSSEMMSSSTTTRPNTSADASHPIYSLLVASEIQQATAADEDGDTPLHIAVSQGEVEMLHQLLYLISMADHSVDPINNLHQTPLHIAVITKQPDVVADLVKAGADPNICDRYGNSSMHLACIHKSAPIMFALLKGSKHTPQLMSKNFEGYIPLHLAVIHEEPEIVKILVHNKPNHINCKDTKNGWTALFHAAARDVEGILEILLQAGPDINSQSYSGNTVLHIASGRGYTEVVRRLMQSGADMSMRNSHRESPAMITNNKVISNLLHGKDYHPRSPTPTAKLPVMSSHQPRSAAPSQTSGWPLTIISPTENVYNPFQKQGNVKPRSSPNQISGALITNPPKLITPGGVATAVNPLVNQGHIAHLRRLSPNISSTTRSNQSSPVVGCNVTVSGDPVPVGRQFEELNSVPDYVTEQDKLSNTKNHEVLRVPCLSNPSARNHDKMNDILKEPEVNNMILRTNSVTDEEVSEITSTMRKQSISDMEKEALFSVTQKDVDYEEVSLSKKEENVKYTNLPKVSVEKIPTIENYQSSVNIITNEYQIETMDNSEVEHVDSASKDQLKVNSEYGSEARIDKENVTQCKGEISNVIKESISNDNVNDKDTGFQTVYKNLDCTKDIQSSMAENNVHKCDTNSDCPKAMVSEDNIKTLMIDKIPLKISTEKSQSCVKNVPVNEATPNVADNEETLFKHYEIQKKLRKHITEKTSRKQTDFEDTEQTSVKEKHVTSSRQVNCDHSISSSSISMDKEKEHYTQEQVSTTDTKQLNNTNRNNSVSDIAMNNLQSGDGTVPSKINEEKTFVENNGKQKPGCNFEKSEFSDTLDTKRIVSNFEARGEGIPEIKIEPPSGRTQELSDDSTLTEDDLNKNLRKRKSYSLVEDVNKRSKVEGDVAMEVERDAEDDTISYRSSTDVIGKQNIDVSLDQPQCTLSTAQALLSLGYTQTHSLTTHRPEDSKQCSVSDNSRPQNVTNCFVVEKNLDPQIAHYSQTVEGSRVLQPSELKHPANPSTETDSRRVSVIVYSQQDIERPKSATGPEPKQLSPNVIPRANSSSPRLMDSTKGYSALFPQTVLNHSQSYPSQIRTESVYSTSIVQGPHSVPRLPFILPENQVITQSYCRPSESLTHVHGAMIREPHLVSQMPHGSQLPHIPHAVSQGTYLISHAPHLVHQYHPSQFVVAKPPVQAGPVVIHTPYQVGLPSPNTSRTQYSAPQSVTGVPIIVQEASSRPPLVLSHQQSLVRPTYTNQIPCRAPIPHTASEPRDEPMDLSCKKKADKPLDMSISKKRDASFAIQRQAASIAQQPSINNPPRSELKTPLAYVNLPKISAQMIPREHSESSVAMKQGIDEYENDESKLLIDESVSK